MNCVPCIKRPCIHVEDTPISVIYRECLSCANNYYMKLHVLWQRYLTNIYAEIVSHFNST